MKLIENLSIIPLEDFLSDNMAWDIFITCGSFENRCLGGCILFLNKQVKLDTAIIFEYPERDPERAKEKNIASMKDMLNLISNRAYIFSSESVSHPSKGIKKFLSFLKENNFDLKDKKMIFDISVFTKPYFFLLFKALKERFNMTEFYVIYTQATDYPLDSEKEEVILTEGLDRIESIPGFMGSTVSMEDALIIILGFEGKRAVEVFRSVDPEVSYCIDGYPSIQPGWHRTSLEANLRFLKESKAYKHLFFAPAIDPFETKKAIEKIVREIKRNNPNLGVIVAPLGTKMQAFGALLYSFNDKEIRIVYPFPSSFNAFYSKYDRSWIFKVDLNKL
jgi:hypothetical protein